MTSKFAVGDKVKIPKTKSKLGVYDHNDFMREYKVKGAPPHMVVENIWDTHVDLKFPNGTKLLACSFYEQDLELLEDKNIIGYKNPIPLFGDSVPAGTVWAKRDKTLHFYNIKDSASEQMIPKEIAETWEPVYEEVRFEEAEYVVALKDISNAQGINIKKGDVKLIDAFGPLRDCFWFSDTPLGKGHFSIGDFRRATKEEVEQEEKSLFTFGRYSLEIRKNVAKFGCQSYTVAELEAYLHLIQGVDATIEVKGRKIGADLIKRILKKLDENK